MFETVWQFNDQYHRRDVSQNRYTALPSSNSPLTDFFSPHHIPVLTQSHKPNTILFANSVVKSLIGMTSEVLRANLNPGWTLRYLPVCDSYPFRSEVLLIGEGGAKA